MLKKFLRNLLFIFVILFCLTSCQGFLQGDNFQKELKDLIEYSNQPDVTINFSTDGGSISPVGDQTYKVTQKIPIICTERRDSKNCFVKWIVKNKKTNHIYTDSELTGLLEFNDINSTDTYVKILSNNQDLIIEAKCVSRPVIATHSPSYSSDGVYRDRRIDVMFTKPMNPDSIYFSEEEISSFSNMGYSPLRDDARNNRCYGYEDSQGIIHFKNITITKRTDENINYLQCYEPPYFDENDSSVLRINAKADNLPPLVTDIFVTIKKEMFYEDSESKNSIALQNDYSWSYYTNSLTDKVPPEFTESGDTAFKVFFANDSSEKIGTNELLKKSTDFNSTSKYKENNSKNCKIWVSGMFSDGGSGPSKLQWEIFKVNSKYYPQNKETRVAYGLVDSLVFSGSNAQVGKIVGNNITDGVCIDLSEYYNNSLLPEGFYKITFTCYDKNERPCVTPKEYYFVQDVTGPSPLYGIDQDRTTGSSTKLSWKNPNYDIAKVTVKSTKIGDTSSINQDFSFTIDNETVNTSKYHTVTGLSAQKKYKHSFILTDICGNVADYSNKTYQDDKAPDKSSLSNMQTYALDRAKIKLTNSTSDYSYSTVNGTTFYNNDEIKLINLGTYSRTHTLNVVDYDYSNNSNSYTLTITTYPSIGMIVYSDKYWCDKDNMPSGKTAVGVICNNSDINNIKIWDLYEYTGYCWGGDCQPDCKKINNYIDGWVCSENSDRPYQHGSGLDWYNLLSSNYPDYFTYTKNNKPTIWKYLKDKNSTQSTVKWYAPGLEEFKYILDNYNTMNPAFTSLGKTCVTINQPYWTGMPRCKSSYAHVGSFGSSKVSNGTDWRLYDNSSSDLKSFWCTSNEREGNWYQKWNWEESYNPEGQKAIYIHAMGVVDLH